MKQKISTSDRILRAGRQLFNSKGYAATSLSDIAEAVGISKGNLSYHFPTKLDLAIRLQEESRQQARERRAGYQQGDIADDYVEHLLFAMQITWSCRFIFRDEIGFPESGDERISELTADYQELAHLIERIDDAGMFRQNCIDDLEALVRSIWIVSRYWMDYLREFEGQSEIDWADQERGIKQHFAVLLPCLTAPAKKRFEAALERADSFRGQDLSLGSAP